MCVDRTASTKVPSARESRASVACQKRAAACAEMLCPRMVRVSLIFITLKVTQAERQIYPERIGKVKRAKFHEKPEGSSFAGGRNRVLHVPLGPMGRVDHQNNRREDDRCCNNGAQRDRLACDEPAKKQRDDGIHKSICCHARGSALLQNVNVRGETDARPEHDEISKREPGAQGNRGKMEPLEFSGEQASE